jgi:hypothetical protein
MVSFWGKRVANAAGVYGEGTEVDMTDKLAALIEKARSVRMSPQESEEQRRSFAYGNTKIENDRITRAMIDERAEALSRSGE